MDPSINICILENDHQHSQSLVQTHGRWAVKLIVHENKVISKEEFLNFISLYIPADSIRALVFDTYYNFHALFLGNAEAFCTLIGMTVKTEAFVINFLPLLDFFVVDNVYPCTSEDELRDIFENFGPVFHVNNYLALPNSSKFSHVISGRREISFILSKNKTDIFIPVNVFHPPYRYRVSKFCPACVTEGHGIMNCPNVKEIKVNQQQAMSNDEDGRVKLSKTDAKDSFIQLDVGEIPSTSKASDMLSQESEQVSEVELPITTTLEGGTVSQDSDRMSEVQSPIKIIPESSSSPSSLKIGLDSENQLSDVSPGLSEKSLIKAMPILLPESSILETKTKSVVISQTEVSTFSSEDSFLMELESNRTSSSTRKRGRPKKSTPNSLKSRRKEASNSQFHVSEEAVPQNCSNEHTTNFCHSNNLEDPGTRKRRGPKKLPVQTELPSDSQSCDNTEIVPQSCSDEQTANSCHLSNLEESIDQKEENVSEKVQEWLSGSTGVLPPKLIEEILLANVWTPSTISHSISRYSTDFQLVIEQLDKLLSECLNGTSFYHLYPKLVLFKKVVKKLQNS